MRFTYRPMCNFHIGMFKKVSDVPCFFHSMFITCHKILLHVKFHNLIIIIIYIIAVLRSINPNSYYIKNTIVNSVENSNLFTKLN